MVTLSALLPGTLSARGAAVFGDIALDRAVSRGFPTGPMETHDMFDLISLGVFIAHSLLRLWTVWRRHPLAVTRRWIAEIPGVAGVVLLFTTAYYGGALVYRFGVDVTAVAHWPGYFTSLRLSSARHSRVQLYLGTATP
jgi:uncharacterized membrane protein